MDHHRRLVTAVMTAVLAGVAATASGQQTPQTVVVVRAYNYAQISADVLASTRDKVKSVFEKAGVRIAWAEPLSTTTAEDASASECRQPFYVQVMIRPRHPGWEPGRKRVIGMALAADDDRAVVLVFYNAVTDVARRYGRALDEILAVAVAHELGHALLPPPSHASSGIMQARWEGEDIRHAILGSLTFSETQAETIRARAERRCVAP